MEIHISKERFILFGEKHGLLHQPTKNISETGFNAADHDVFNDKSISWVKKMIFTKCCSRKPGAQVADYPALSVSVSIVELGNQLVRKLMPVQ